uniref:NADP-dependent oxidoreductase domain-containing protein n=1 Tax=Mycena chlorophos TaxID=658473 RepID=A0ABQ0LMM9_MYCCL|nr:predicted protein [Mycena chlorophos]
MAKQAYAALPTIVDGTPSGSDQSHPQKRRPPTRLLYPLLAASFFMLLVLTGLRRAGPRQRSCVGWGVYLDRKLSTKLTLPTHYTLPSGDKIPAVALERNQVGEAVKTALKAGYRHIDGAWIYRNEEEVGQALQESEVPREEVFITSKLWNTFHDPSAVESALDDSLAKLNTSYLDLYLMHWPLAADKSKKGYNASLTEDPYPTWQKLEEMVEKGKVKNIGVSNFNVRRLERLFSKPLKIQPAVNQVEISYHIPQSKLLAYARSKSLLLEAYSPLGGDGKVGETLKLPVVKKIAEETGMTPAQVVISWAVQRGVVVLPKSVTPSRVVENLQVQALPQHLFDELEEAATSHAPYPRLNPSKGWGLDFDIFDGDEGV